MQNYICLKTHTFHYNKFHIEPIRNEDRYEIMKIRNEQIFHLRQSKPLTIEEQDNYFNNVVSKLFYEKQPNQLLFSFFENNNFIGYGGLVHINWIDKNAEISFVMKTELQNNYFAHYWSNFLKLIEELAFIELDFHKIFTYAFDVRPHLYEVLVNNNYYEEARLKEHCFFNGKYTDVLYHSKINKKLTMRLAQEQDMQLYYSWANDKTVRNNSYTNNEISLETHKAWFFNKLNDDNCSMYIFENHNKEHVGQVRIQKNDDTTAIIGISVDANHRKKGYATKMIKKASEDFLNKNKNFTIFAYIKIDNLSSKKSFENANYQFKENLIYLNQASYLYTTNYENR